ncbi:MAG: sigma-70 family RNA polymerase sigma factor [Gammaproteobacteria bacterium]|nr:sigma-70 family RNA polymerase sigma factor [Gammaproteobacteria bacterium]
MSPATEADREHDERLAELLRRCAVSDGEALQGLYGLTAPTLLACLMRILRRRSLAEEALQDVFVTVWQRAGQFRAERGRPMAWLVSIARYRAIDLLRHERFAAVLVADLPQGAAIAEEGEEDAAIPLSGGRLLERCLALLTGEQRQCLELAFVGGSSHADIARRMGSPLGTVKSWIRRALQSLKVCLES